MTKLNLSAVVCLITSLAAGTAMAQTEAAAVKLGGGINFTPSLNFDLLHDDNVTYAETDEIDSMVAVINPNFLLSTDDGVSAYSLNYSLIKGEYFDSEEDNYTDHIVTGDAGWELNSRNRLDLSASLSRGHEARGTGFSQGAGNTLAEPDAFWNDDINGTYTFGAESAKGQIALQLGTGSTDYNGGLRTVSRDRGTDYGSVTFNYNAWSKTRLLLEVGRREIVYDYITPGVSTLDSSETSYLVGVTWEGTAKTSGTVMVGSLRKDFESADREDFTGPSWEVAVTWEPRSYSTFDFSTARRSSETSGFGNFIDVENYTVDWSHTWTDRVSSQLSFDHSLKTFKNEAVDREDEINTVGLSVNYQMRRWLGFSAGVTMADLDSSGDGFNYGKNVTFIGLQASL